MHHKNFSDVNGTSINVVAGHSATLPCDTSTGRTSSREQPSLILWFKEEDGKPIFRFLKDLQSFFKSESPSIFLKM